MKSLTINVDQLTAKKFNVDVRPYSQVLSDVALSNQNPI